MAGYSKKVTDQKLKQAMALIEQGTEILKDVAERGNHWGLRMAVARFTDSAKYNLTPEIQSFKEK